MLRSAIFLSTSATYPDTYYIYEISAPLCRISEIIDPWPSLSSTHLASFPFHISRCWNTCSVQILYHSIEWLFSKRCFQSPRYFVPLYYHNDSWPQQIPDRKKARRRRSTEKGGKKDGRRITKSNGHETSRDYIHRPYTYGASRLKRCGRFIGSLFEFLPRFIKTA